MPDEQTLNTQPEGAVAAENTSAAETASGTRPRRAALATLSFIITLAAWAMLPLVYWVAGALALAGIVSGAIAARSRRSGWRNLAQVSIVACSVLVLVLIVFWGILLYLLNA